MLGSKSGFDSVEECFGDLTPAIFALETGLSSDPVSYTHLRAHETVLDLVCRLLLEKKKTHNISNTI